MVAIGYHTTYAFSKTSPEKYSARERSSHMPTYVKRDCPLIREWLTRSGALPLDIYFQPKECADHSSSQIYELVKPYVDTLLLFAHRWRIFEMRIPQDDHGIFNRIADLSTEDVPLLESLFLVYNAKFIHHTSEEMENKRYDVCQATEPPHIGALSLPNDHPSQRHGWNPMVATDLFLHGQHLK
ncbi:hypothetical protein B0H34DRAFT_258073 [Crassisporium funariophilum]|nr:hypothetical protein B0H34DRAFT_258073 [Crassisporium funariophilum]